MSACSGPGCRHPAHVHDRAHVTTRAGAAALHASRFDPDSPSPLNFTKSDVPVHVLERRLSPDALTAAIHVVAHLRGHASTRARMAEALRNERRFGPHAPIAIVSAEWAARSALRELVVFP